MAILHRLKLLIQQLTGKVVISYQHFYRTGSWQGQQYYIYSKVNKVRSVFFFVKN